MTTTFFWVAGLGLIVALAGHLGFAQIGTALASVGWGFLAVAACYPPALIVDSLCWRELLPRASRPSVRTLLWPRWICDAVNALLPVAQIGGDLVRAKMLTARGVSPAQAGASVVADVTVGIATEIVFAFMGIVLLFHSDGMGPAAVAALSGAVALLLLAVAFYLAQHAGLFHKLARLFGRFVRIGEWGGVVGGAKALDAELVATYMRRREFLLAGAWRMIGWFVGVAEVWVALYFLGHRVGLVEAVILESLGQAVRHAAFMVPGGLGVQEGGFIVLGAATGLAPETGLALSLVKRVRELLVGLPPILAWQFTDGPRFFGRRRHRTDHGLDP